MILLTSLNTASLLLFSVSPLSRSLCTLPWTFPLLRDPYANTFGSQSPLTRMRVPLRAPACPSNCLLGKPSLKFLFTIISIFKYWGEGEGRHHLGILRRRSLYFWLFERGCHYAVQADLELIVILLPPPHKHWNYSLCHHSQQKKPLECGANGLRVYFLRAANSLEVNLESEMHFLS